jgi:hypothetical protein
MSLTDLDGILATLRAVSDGERVATEVAARAEPHIQAGLEKTLSAGEEPAGKGWAPRKSGGKAYAHAAGHVVTKHYGKLIRVTLSGPEVYGHFGNSHLPQRKMIPDGGAGMPPSIADALGKGASEAFDALVKGAK